MENRKKLGFWLLLLSLAQSPLTTLFGASSSHKKKADSHYSSKKVEKKSSKKSSKKEEKKISKKKSDIGSKKTAISHHKSGKNTNRNEEKIDNNWVEKGRACIYSNNLDGSRTATGERFDKDALTAAHLHLPLGSRVRVTSLESGKSVVVRINDRGPFSPKYKLDMSPAAAQKIGLNFTKGTMSVRIERLKKASQKSESLAAQ